MAPCGSRPGHPPAPALSASSPPGPTGVRGDPVCSRPEPALPQGPGAVARVPQRDTHRPCCGGRWLWEIPHVAVGAGKPHDLPSSSWRPGSWRCDSVASEGLRPGGARGPSPRLRAEDEAKNKGQISPPFVWFRPPPDWTRPTTLGRAIFSPEPTIQGRSPWSRPHTQRHPRWPVRGASTASGPTLGSH